MLQVIVVDDEPAILEDLKDTLNSMEAVSVINTFSNPEEVVDKLSGAKVDCAFLDIEMPGMSGIELADRLTAVYPDIEIIFVTAYNHYAAQAFEVNALDYLLKPIRPERLKKAIDKVKRKELIRENVISEQFSIRCFGPFQVAVGSQIVKWPRSKSKEVLAYLLQHEGKWISKFKLCDEQWADYGPDQALAYLQTSIYALRKTLKEMGFEGISIDYMDDRYRLKVENVNWDIRSFERQYQQFLQTGSAEALQNALALYSGDYLEGEDWLWSELMRRNYAERVTTLQNKLQLDQSF